MKVAGFAATRNMYEDMETCAKALAINSSVDAIYFLIEDPEFPTPLPDYIHCIDVSRQEYFGPRCPNIYKLWSYMTLMRVAWTKYLPDLDRILWLDCDVIVNQNIDELWDLNLDGYFVAAVKEPYKTKKNGSLYVNAGVSMLNLDMLRKTRMDDKMIRALNFKKFGFADQDCLNELCKGHILQIDQTYNSNNYTQPSKHNWVTDDLKDLKNRVLIENPKVIHYANEPHRRIRPLYLKYHDIPWEEIRRNT